MFRIELTPAESFRIQLERAGISCPAREYRFHPTRKWRIDFAWPSIKLAIEIEGAVWTQGRHTRGSGFLRDMEKYNTLSLEGWALLRFAPEWVNDGRALEYTKRALSQA